MSLNRIKILQSRSRSMLLAWFQSELVPVVLHNSKNKSSCNVTLLQRSLFTRQRLVRGKILGGGQPPDTGPIRMLLLKKGMAAAGSGSATDIASWVATLPLCDVRDSFDCSIILL